MSSSITSDVNLRRSRSPSSVLFLCNHNVIRSPMAEYLLRSLYGTDIYCDSAGVTAGRPDPFVSVVLEESGIDFGEFAPKSLDDLEDSWFDLVVTLSPQAHHIALSSPLLESGGVLYWAAGDPTVVHGSREQRLDAYREVRDLILSNLRDYFAISGD